MTFTTMSDERVAYTVLTAVARSDRGQGLALAMKLRAVAALRDAGVALFGTSNDAGNAPMRRINARLGYVPDPPSIQVEKRFVRIAHLPDGVAVQTRSALPGTRTADEMVRMPPRLDGVAPQARQALPGTRSAD
ncbi:MAG: hypothetical protein M3442_01005 [Chloroflexota bacterium]|nr:hypothetical protein [Chloroflexota bacterium]